MREKEATFCLHSDMNPSTFRSLQFQVKHLLPSPTCTMHVWLTIFVSIFSPGTDFTAQHLDVFAAGSAVQLVDPVVPATHGVSHLCLVLYVHAEVHPIHTEYLLERRTHIPESQGVMHGLGKTKQLLYCWPALGHASTLSPVMDCTSPATSGYIC